MIIIGTLKKLLDDSNSSNDNNESILTPPLSPPLTPTLSNKSLSSELRNRNTNLSDNGNEKPKVDLKIRSNDEINQHFSKVTDEVSKESFETFSQRINYTDKLMKCWYKHDDPELIIVHHLQPSFLSNSLQLKGFPSWQLRIGEIYFENLRLPFSRGPLTSKILNRSLLAYSKVEQRLGK